MSMFDGFTDGAEITEESLNVGGGNSFNFEPATNAVFRLIDVETRNINPTFGGIEYTLEMLANDEGVNIGDQKRHLFKTIQGDDDQGKKSSKIENGYFKASVAAMGFKGRLTSKDEIIGKTFMADVTIYKNPRTGKESQNMRNFRPVETAQAAPSQPAQQAPAGGGFGSQQPQQPQGFGAQGGGFGQQSGGFGAQTKPFGQ